MTFLRQTAQSIVGTQFPDGIQWFRLLDTLNPGDTAPANMLYWDAGNNRMAEIDERIYINDRWFSAAQDDDSHTQYGRNFGLMGEVFQCIPFPGTDDWCCIGSQGLLRAGGPVADILADAYGDVEIYVGDATDYVSPFTNDVGQFAVDELAAVVTVSAYYHWITSLDKVVQDGAVLVHYFPDRFRWEIIDHRCDSATVTIPT